MFKWILVLVAISGYFETLGQDKIDSIKSSVKFTIKNFGISVNGSISGLKGDIRFNINKPETSHFNVSVESKTLKTGIVARDKHIKNEDWLFVEKFPAISFRSEKVWQTSDKQYQVTGTLTIKDKSKQISFPFTANAEDGGKRFKGSFTINRRDYNVGGGNISMSDNLNIVLSVYAD